MAGDPTTFSANNKATLLEEGVVGSSGLDELDDDFQM